LKIVYDELCKRQRQGRLIRVVVLGAGTMGTAIIRQINRAIPGIFVVAVVNRTMRKAENALREAGIANIRMVSSLQEFEESQKSGETAYTDDFEVVIGSASVDAVVEVTGAVEYSAKAVLFAISHRKHVILMNAELDATVGPLLKIKADAAGVMYTNVDGDQPGKIVDLYRYVLAMGLKPVLCGNIKGLQDPYRTPETQAAFAKKWNQGAHAVTSFADGTKISFEQAVVANATGMRVARRGMLGPAVPSGTPLREAVKSFSESKLLDATDGFVDYIVGPEPNGGIFVLAAAIDRRDKHFLALYKVGDGPLYCFYDPYHLCQFEAPYSIARAVIFGEATAAPAGLPKVDVVATAKRDLRKGETIDAIGGFMTYGQCENAEVSLAENLFPMGLAEGCVIMQDIPKDAVLHYGDVEQPAGRAIDALRAEQDALLASSGILGPAA